MLIIELHTKLASEPRLLHGADYNPDQWLAHPEILQEDIDLMQKTASNTFSVGIFAWAALEPSEGNFQFEWLDGVMDRIAQIEGNVVLATPSAARPVWLARKYPEVLRTNALRQKHLFGERHNHCPSSPVYREKVRIINTQLATRYKSHPALFMWHVSNEYGGECHCDLCQESFRAWLRKKYTTIDALNAAYWSAFWSHTYSDFSEIDSPSPIGEPALHGLNLDWRRFVSDITLDFYLAEIAPLREITPDIPVTTNFMGEFPHPGPMPFAGLDYTRFAPHVDIIAWDAYPPWHNDYETTAQTAAKLAFLNDYFRSLRDGPFLILECTPGIVNWHAYNRAKRPGMHMLFSVASLAHGADGIMYFQWRASRGSSEKFHGAVVGHDGENSRTFKEVAQVGRMLAHASEIKNTRTVARVALMFDIESLWSLNDAQGFCKNDKKYAECVHDHYAALWQANIPVDIVWPGKDLSSYNIVIAPMMYMLDKNQIEIFNRFVAGGGILVGTYLSGLVDKNDLVYPNAFAPGMRELFGIQVTETDTLYPKQTNTVKMPYLPQGEYTVRDYCAVVELAGAQQLGTYTGDFYASGPAITQMPHNRGQAYFLAARAGADFYRDFYKKICISIMPQLPISASAGVSVQCRTSDTCEYYFVMNFSEDAAQMTLAAPMTDIITGYAIDEGIHQMKPYGVHILKPS